MPDDVTKAAWSADQAPADKDTTTAGGDKNPDNAGGDAKTDKNPDQGGDSKKADPNDTKSTDTKGDDSKGDQKWKYTELISKYWENVVSQMISEKQKIDSILANKEELNELTKEEILQLYQTKESIEKNLDEILPAINEKKQAEFIQKLDGIENEEVRKLLMEEVIPNISDEKEVDSVLTFTQKIIELVWSWTAKKWDDPDWNDDKADLANGVKGKWEDDVDLWGMDLAQALMSDDPEIRAKAKAVADQWFNSLLNSNT